MQSAPELRQRVDPLSHNRLVLFSQAEVRKRREFLMDQLNRCTRIRGEIHRKEDALRSKASTPRAPPAAVPLLRPACPGWEEPRKARQSNHRKKADPDFEQLPDDDMEDGGVRRPLPTK